MVKNYVKLIVALLFATNLTAQNVPNYVPTNGLVGWWPFNGNANDESGNGNHGTVNGATLTTDRNGQSNRAYSFDGVNDNINPLQNNLPFGASARSVSVWFQRIGSGGCLFSYGTANTGNAYMIAVGSNIIANQGWTSPDFPVFPSVNNNWNNVVCTFDGTSSKIYYNGILQGTGNMSALNTIFNSFYFGTRVLNDMDFFNGNIDDIAIYNRSLTQEEITALYTSTPPCTNPTATITPQGNTSFCQGGFVNLNASTGANYTYEWYNNGQLINGVTASTYQATTSGNYTVKVIDGACNATSTATTVTVNQYPSSVVNVSGNTTFCEGNNVVLTAQGSGTYLWSNGETTKSISINKSGVYGVAVTSNGCVSNSNQTTVTVNPNPTASITPQGNTSFCQGGFVNLVASGGTSFQWNTGSSVASISATQSGTYTVNVFNAFGCQATTSQSVTVYPLPNVAFNALNQFTLKNASLVQLLASPAGGTFLGDGVQGTTFNPANVTLGKKTITYTYTSPEGCSGSASRSTIIADTLGNVCSTYDTLKVIFKLTTGIKANQYTTMHVYPNPTSDVIVIDASDVAALNGYSYKVFDVQGKEVYNALVTTAKTEISLKTFGKAGVYILHVVDANNASIQTKQIVLE